MRCMEPGATWQVRSSPRRHRRGRGGDGPGVVGRRRRPVLPPRGRHARPRSLARAADGQLLGTMFELDGRPPRPIRVTCSRASCAGSASAAIRRWSQSSSSSTCSSVTPTGASVRRAAWSPAAQRRIQAYGSAASTTWAAVRRSLRRGARPRAAGAHADVRVRSRPVRAHPRAPGRRAARGRRGDPVQARGARVAASTAGSPASWPSRSRNWRHRHAPARELADRDGRNACADEHPPARGCCATPSAGCAAGRSRRHGGVRAARQFPTPVRAHELRTVAPTGA